MAISASNLKWYLSGGAANSDPAASLGGAKSSVALSATALNNLFDDITGAEATAGRTEYRCLYFQNIDADVNGLLSAILWFTAQPSGGQEIMYAGLDLAGKNGTADTVVNETTAPDPVVTFANPSSKGTGIALPTPMVQNDYIGVWFKRVTAALSDPSAAATATFKVEGDTI